MTPSQLATHFFLAAAVILLACRLVAMAAARIGQPPVVAEMITGILLGPSLLGLISSRLEAALFPAALLPMLYVAGQLGLAALMFQAGRHLRGHLRPGLGRSAASISLLGVGVPLTAGVGLTFAARGHVPVFLPGVSATVTAGFVGVALAITAFPMLARIIVERGLAGTSFGSLSLASGAVDDLAAWILLAGVLSLAAGSTWQVAKAAGGGLLFAALLLLVIRPVLARVLARPTLAPSTVLLIIAALLFGAAWFTSDIGLYAVFGAFSIGLALPAPPAAAPVPEGEPAAEGAPVALADTTIDGVSRLLVPMFFTYSGLNTRFALLTSPRLLIFSVAAIVVAVLGKFGSCWLGARLRGEPQSSALRVGALMNARGLMQLIALNVGLQAHIAGHELFTSLVLVALVTTVMTAPVLTWLDRRDARRTPEAPGVPELTGAPA